MIVLAHVGGDLAGIGQATLVAVGVLTVAWLDRTGRATGVLPTVRRTALWLGTGVGLVAVVGPLETAAHRGFAAHMVQHLLLLLVVAPALVVARPDLVVLRALPGRARRRTALGSRRVALRWPLGPVVGGLLLASWLWVAHVPSVYAAQLDSPWVHALEHGLWVAVGVGFWTPLLRQRPSTTRRVLTPLIELVSLMPASSLLALTLLSGPEPRFAHHADLGAGALADQRLGAALMWAAMTVVLLGASLVVIGTSEPRRGSARGPSSSRASPGPPVRS